MKPVPPRCFISSRSSDSFIVHHFIQQAGDLQYYLSDWVLFFGEMSKKPNAGWISQAVRSMQLLKKVFEKTERSHRFGNGIEADLGPVFTTE